MNFHYKVVPKNRKNTEIKPVRLQNVLFNILTLINVDNLKGN